ncbi:poly [ADP-ribose] polymerase tankyrase-2-like [Neocloeon triangulifer]|uniref:poly [ADP-ribose] polymerase tankyrase-2-like n=1 Tax=Neocloeon triangulifer TaxID=2078957 RepID=UPI00286EF3F5|nr:poly [ADP-ribose] polymerase tankyrase-2-like [Neocloeon triangulifer]XP_059470190.1 poly [ADP-ribose] polymerase tankyrase-2-like [Neocloeon triangulifer]
MPRGNWFDGIELEELSATGRCFAYVRDKMHNTIVHDEVESYDIKQAYRINNKHTWPLYVKRRAQISQDLGGKRVTEKRIFHGSPNALAIASEGFDRGFAKNSGMFGNGVYFAENSSKSNNYAFGNFKPCQPHNNRRCQICIRRVLICKVAVGRVYNTTDTITSLPSGFHSVRAEAKSGFLKFPEYIIYNDDQVFPSFLIEYTTNYKQGVPRPFSAPNPLRRSFNRRNGQSASNNVDPSGILSVMFPNLNLNSP